MFCLFKSPKEPFQSQPALMSGKWSAAVWRNRRTQIEKCPFLRPRLQWPRFGHCFGCPDELKWRLYFVQVQKGLPFSSNKWPVWPDWAIYWTLGNFSKHLATINLPKSPTFLGNFCKGVKLFNFSSEIFYRHLATFGTVEVAFVADASILQLEFSRRIFFNVPNPASFCFIFVLFTSHLK